MVDQATAQSCPARLGVDEQDSKLRGGVVDWDAEHASHPLSVRLGDPCGAAVSLRGVGVVGHDLRDECFERRVPAELGVVELAVRHDNPPEISRFTEPPDDRKRVVHVCS